MKRIWPSQQISQNFFLEQKITSPCDMIGEVICFYEEAILQFFDVCMCLTKIENKILENMCLWDLELTLISTKLRSG